MNTNAVPPDIQNLINSLPPTWQHYAVIGFILLMAIGRILYANHLGASWGAGLLSIFTGSHSASQAAATAAPASTPTASGGKTDAAVKGTTALLFIAFCLALGPLTAGCAVGSSSFQMCLVSNYFGFVKKNAPYTLTVVTTNQFPGTNLPTVTTTVTTTPGKTNRFGITFPINVQAAVQSFVSSGEIP